MDDERFDGLLREAARHYNAPPPTPAEAMWAAIQARRAAAPTPVPPTPDSAPPRALADAPHSIGARRLRWATRWAGVATAAAALVALGVEIGQRTPEHVSPADGAAVRTASAPTASPSGPAVGAPDRGARASSSGGGRTAVVDATPRSGAPGRHGAGAGTATARAPEPALAALGTSAKDGGPGAARGEPAPYSAAAADHLAQAEVLLTAFRANAPRDTLAAAPDAAWARDLLTTTRLLLDSPAARDPERRRLFQDLELVLVQIVQLPRADDREERTLIDQAIRRGDVLTKLRAARPATLPPRGT